MGLISDEIDSYRNPEVVAREKEEQRHRGLGATVVRSGIQMLTQYEMMREMALMRSVQAQSESKSAMKTTRAQMKNDKAREADIQASREEKASAMQSRKVSDSQYDDSEQYD
jgi:hypothetical protein